MNNKTVSDNYSYNKTIPNAECNNHEIPEEYE
jgi:hypothetical protein